MRKSALSIASLSLFWFPSLALTFLSTPNDMDRPFTTAHSKAPFAVGERFFDTGFSQSIDVEQAEDEPLVQAESEFQSIAVYSNRHYGKILVLDGVVQLTERDGDSYNEMMAHVPLMAHPNPERVLVIGGGDGYVVSEVLKHPSVKHVDHVELDQGVVDFCKQHFPQFAYEDKRVLLHIQDGSKFVASAPADFYDVIIQDSSDPNVRHEDGTEEVLPSKVLFTDDHFKHCHRILTPNGVFNMQSETFHLPDDVKGMCQWRSQIRAVGFDSAQYGSIYTGSYPCGQIGFLLCEKKKANEEDLNVQRRFDNLTSTPTTYYWPGMQTSCFVLPRWLHKTLYGKDTP